MSLFQTTLLFLILQMTACQEPIHSVKDEELIEQKDSEIAAAIRKAHDAELKLAAFSPLESSMKGIWVADGICLNLNFGAAKLVSFGKGCDQLIDIGTADVIAKAAEGPTTTKFLIRLKVHDETKMVAIIEGELGESSLKIPALDDLLTGGHWAQHFPLEKEGSYTLERQDATASVEESQ